jgi:hypothetical protein
LTYNGRKKHQIEGDCASLQKSWRWGRGDDVQPTRHLETRSRIQLHRTLFEVQEFLGGDEAEARET